MILNSAADGAEKIYETVKRTADRDFSLASVSGLDWNADLSPWPSPGVVKGGGPFGGGADAYLGQLEEEIIPEILGRMPAEPLRIIIAGYSLAGLFALYSLYRTRLFSGAASVSGSLWFPGFTEFAESNEMMRRPERIYLSLGDKESQTANPVLAASEKKTRRMNEYFRSEGIETVFEMNPGNHFRDPCGRTARGILRIISRYFFPVSGLHRQATDLYRAGM